MPAGLASNPPIKRDRLRRANLGDFSGFGGRAAAYGPVVGRPSPHRREYNDLKISGPRIKTNTKIVESAADRHHYIACTVIPQTNRIFKDTASLDTTDDVFYSHATMGNKPIRRLLLV
jgi:hypothetical protein